MTLQSAASVRQLLRSREPGPHWSIRSSPWVWDILCYKHIYPIYSKIQWAWAHGHAIASRVNIRGSISTEKILERHRLLLEQWKSLSLQCWCALLLVLFWEASWSTVWLLGALWSIITIRKWNRSRRTRGSSKAKILQLHILISDRSTSARPKESIIWGSNAETSRWVSVAYVSIAWTIFRSSLAKTS